MSGDFTNVLEGRKIAVVKRILDKNKVAWSLVLLWALSPGVAVVVGTCSHNAQIGIAVSTGIILLASFILQLTAWLMA